MKLEYIKILVVDVIFDPVAITPQKLGYYKGLGLIYDENYAALPRNTIVGKKILEATASSFEPLTFFFPFFPPHLSMPCKPGEHMWALMDHDKNTRQEFGYWVCRITEPWYVDDLNHTHAPRRFDPSLIPSKKDRLTGVTPKYDFDNGIVEIDTKGERSILRGSEFASIPGFDDDTLYKKLIDKSETQTNASRLNPPSSVPRYKKRPGDLVLEGSNNSLIVLGTNRKDKVAEYSDISLKVGGEDQIIKSPTIPNGDIPSGSIDIVVGRGQTTRTAGEKIINSLGLPELDKVIQNANQFPNEGDPDLANDKSRIRLSENTKVDLDLGIDFFNNASFSIVDSVEGDGAIVIKTDKLRLIARKDVEIMVGIESNDPNTYAAVVIKTDGSIVFKPSDKGYIKLGSDNADKALMCSDHPAVKSDGTVLASAIFTTGSDLVCTGADGQGKFAKKILVD